MIQQDKYCPKSEQQKDNLGKFGKTTSERGNKHTKPPHNLEIKFRKPSYQ